MDEEEMSPTLKVEESILTSIKKLLGLSEDNESFDVDIIMNVNSAIAILNQIGVGPTEGFIVTSKDDTYADWLGDLTNIALVKMYLFYRTRLSFDPPSNGALMESLKEEIREMESRLSYQVDPSETFIEEEEV